MAPFDRQISNKLLQALPEPVLSRLWPALEEVELPRGFSIARQNQEIGHCFFFDRGIGSIVVTSPEGHKAEAGIFDSDGFGPVAPVLGIMKSDLDMFVQVPGFGYRISVDRLIFLKEEWPVLAEKLRAFAYVLGLQTSYTAHSNAIHQVHERLARWLLMCHDRSGSDEIALTHEFISLMLAVRRPSVTTALHVLEGNRFITAERGYITIRDRDGLEQFAADAYGAPEAAYRRLVERHAYDHASNV